MLMRELLFPSNSTSNLEGSAKLGEVQSASKPAHGEIPSFQECASLNGRAATHTIAAPCGM